MWFLILQRNSKIDARLKNLFSDHFSLTSKTFWHFIIRKGNHTEIHYYQDIIVEPIIFLDKDVWNLNNLSLHKFDIEITRITH